MLAAVQADLLKTSISVKEGAPVRASAAPYRVVAVGDTIISEQGLVAIIGRDPRYAVCGAAHTFHEANRLIRQHRPDLLLIEPFLENRDAICWIKDLATEFPRIRILVVSRQSELTYAERALHAGASGYWMKNSSVEELMRAIKTVLAGEIYASQAIASLAMRKFARRGDLPQGMSLFSDREMAVISLMAAGHGVGQIESGNGHFLGVAPFPCSGAISRFLAGGTFPANGIRRKISVVFYGVTPANLTLDNKILIFRQ